MELKPQTMCIGKFSKYERRALKLQNAYTLTVTVNLHFSFNLTCLVHPESKFVDRKKALRENQIQADMQPDICSLETFGIITYYQ